MNKDGFNAVKMKVHPIVSNFAIAMKYGVLKLSDC
jgi:hypothetical protein